jgi:RNA polymerase sigma factor (sigma-70 family)
MNDSSDEVVKQTGERVTFAPDDRRYVYSVVRRIVGSADEAEDATQEALVLAFRYRDSFRGHSRYRTWLHRIAVTSAITQLRRRARSRTVTTNIEERRSALEQGIDPAESAVDLLVRAEDRATVRRALAELPSSYREVLLERAGASEVEVAARLGISVANVKIRAHRARKWLRESLNQMERAAV